jgi:hypothetical protein
MFTGRLLKALYQLSYAPQTQMSGCRGSLESDAVANARDDFLPVNSEQITKPMNAPQMSTITSRTDGVREGTSD